MDDLYIEYLLEAYRMYITIDTAGILRMVLKISKGFLIIVQQLLENNNVIVVTKLHL